LSAIVLIVGWGILGPGRLWIRLLSAPAFAGLWFLPWNSAVQPRQLETGFFTIYLCAVLAFVGGVRLSGIRIVRTSPGQASEIRAQFSLLSLLLAVTIFSIVIGVLESLRPVLGADTRAQWSDMSDILMFPPFSVRNAESTRQIVIATATALSGIAGGAIVLRPGGAWLRLMSVAVIVPAAAFYLAHWGGSRGGDFLAT